VTAPAPGGNVGNFGKGVGKTFSKKVFLTLDPNTRAEGTNKKDRF
jgi:hypothetical protein